MLLAAKYPNHRVELRQADNNMQGLSKTVIQEGPLGERYREFTSSSTFGAHMDHTMQRTSLNGAASLRIEFRVRFSSSALSGGYPNGAGGWTYVTGIGGDGNRTRAVFNVSGTLYLTVQGVGAASSDISTSVAVGAFAADTWYDFRIDFTASNGSNSLASFYKSTDGGANWSPIGDTERTGTAITVTIPAGSPYWIGSVSGAPGINGMRVARVQYYYGTSTPDPVLPERIDRFTAVSGVTSLSSILGGSPTIYIDQAAQDGATLSPGGFFTGSGAGDFATEAYRCWTEHLHDFIQINTCHNDKDLSLVEWEDQMDSAVENILSRPALKPMIIHTTQNPEVEAFENDELVLEHQRRQADILKYSSRNNRGCTDIDRAFLDANNLSGLIDDTRIHPTTNLGYPLWGQTFFRLMQAS
jgi:hypothetical protein